MDKELARQVLQEQEATAQALRSLGRKPPSHSAEGIRIALANAWHRLAELKADAATPDLLAEMSEALTELEAQAEQYLNWRVSSEENIPERFETLKTFASGLVNQLKRELDNLEAAFRRILDGDGVDNKLAVLALECQIINYDLFRYLLARAFDEMPNELIPRA
jgi:hypothetical protein